MDTKEEFTRHSSQCVLIDAEKLYKSGILKILKVPLKIKSKLLNIMIKIAVRTVNVPSLFEKNILNKLNSDQEILCCIFDDY
jgi:hypothetical protein